MDKRYGDKEIEAALRFPSSELPRVAASELQDMLRHVYSDRQQIEEMLRELQVLVMLKDGGNGFVSYAKSISSWYTQTLDEVNEHSSLLSALKELTGR